MMRRAAKSTSEAQTAYQKYGPTRQYRPCKVCAPIGASQRCNTTYRHLDASLEEIPAEFDPRYKTQPFDRPRFRRTDTVNSVSVYSKAAAPTIIQSQEPGPSNTHQERQEIELEGSMLARGLSEPSSPIVDNDEMDMDDLYMPEPGDDWVIYFMNEDPQDL